MLPIPLFKAGDDRDRERHADILAKCCDIEVRSVTNKPNAMPTKYKTTPIVPVCCVAVECGYWQLYCNDPELSKDNIREIAGRLRAWEKTRGFTKES